MSTIDLGSVDFPSGFTFNLGMDRKKLLEAIQALKLQANILESLVSESISEAEEEAVRRNNQGLCTYCGEPHGSGRVIRGAHERCHKRINRAVNAFEHTDAQVVKRGWLLPKDFGGRKPMVPKDELETKKSPKKARRRK